jgi:type I restriction enzyme S subunit
MNAPARKGGAVGRTATIEEATECIIDYRGKTPPKTERGVRLVTAKVIKDGQIRDEPAEYISEEYYDEWMRRGLPRPNDVLVTTEAPLGEVAVIRGGERIALAQRVILLRARSGLVHGDYLFYAMRSPRAQAELQARSTGTTVAGIKQSELRQVRIPLFDPGRQRRIADVLSSYDTLIENCGRRIKVLDELARALFREWFVELRYPGNRAGGKLPAGWRRSVAGDVAYEVRRGVPKGVVDDVCYVGLEHIPRRSLALDSWEFVAELGSNKLQFEAGEVLFGKIRPYFHKVAVAPCGGVCSADTFVVRPRAPDLYSFMVGLVSNDEFVAHASATANGAKMPRANWDVMMQFPVSIPPKELLARFDELMRPWLDEQRNLVARIRVLRETRDLLLPRLFSGQLSVAGAE